MATLFVGCTLNNHAWLHVINIDIAPFWCNFCVNPVLSWDLPVDTGTDWSGDSTGFDIENARFWCIFYVDPVYSWDLLVPMSTVNWPPLFFCLASLQKRWYRRSAWPPNEAHGQFTMSVVAKCPPNQKYGNPWLSIPLQSWVATLFVGWILSNHTYCKMARRLVERPGASLVPTFL